MGNDQTPWLVEDCVFAIDVSSVVAAAAAVVKTLPLVAACKLGVVFETLPLVVTFGLGAASGFETLPLTVTCGLGAVSGVEALPLTVTCGLGAASGVETLPLGVTCGLGLASEFAVEVNILLAEAGMTSVAVVVCEVWSS